jgi:MinD-like ATPase involved in chromosome partitioning or flagellar assembly
MDVHKIFIRIGENSPQLMVLSSDVTVIQDAYNMVRWIMKNKKYINDMELEYVVDEDYNGSY